MCRVSCPLLGTTHMADFEKVFRVKVKSLNLCRTLCLAALVSLFATSALIGSQGTIVRVPNSPEALQAAVDRSTPGQVLTLPEDSVYGPLILPGRRLDIRVECDRFDERFGSVRRLPLSATVPRIESDSAGRRPLESRFGTAGVELRGLRIVSTRAANDGNSPSPIVEFGRGENYAPPTAFEDLPREITLTKCDIFSTAEMAAVGVVADAESLRLVGCRITGIVFGKKDTQGVIVTNSRGPVEIIDCEISASGECVLAGGGPVVIPGLRNLERGLTIAHCDIHKPLEWKTRPGVFVKNLLELKNCWLARIHHNRFSNCWHSAQDGTAIVITPREENPTRYLTTPPKRSQPNPWTFVGDVEFTDNLVENVDGGVRISTDDDITLATDRYLLERYAKLEGSLTDVEQQEYERLKAQGARGILGVGSIRMRNNTFRNVGHFGANGRIIDLVGSNPATWIRELVVESNTLTHSDAAGARRNSVLFFEGEPFVVNRFRFRRNVYTRGQYGVFATGGAQGRKALDAWMVDYEWHGNTCLDGEDVE